MNSFISFIFIIIFISSCTITYDIKAKQSTYNVIKVKHTKDKCEMEQVNFETKKNGVFITKNEFTKLANNINKFNICCDNYFKRNNTNLEYYERIIEAFGGKFVD